MIRGIVKQGAIQPVEPIPAEWADGQPVTIAPADDAARNDRAEIERWYAELQRLGPAQYEPNERAAIEKVAADADREAKEAMRRSWASFNGAISPGHQPPQRGPER